MKRLTLVRHAHAEPEDRHTNDFDRSLSDRGVNEVKAAAAAFAPTGAPVDLILSSPARRAYVTAQWFAAALAYPTKRIATELPLYLASAETVLFLLEKLDDTLGHVIVVGHNPGLSVVARQLSGNLQMGELNTAGVYTMDVSQGMIKLSTQAR